MLDIIIPHYREAWEIGEKLFRMIGLQRGINFDDLRVVLINDGEEGAISQEFLDRQEFPYMAEAITIPHGGVSAARNKGIDIAESEWVMFCDFDDCFAGVYALRDLMSLLPDSGGFDMLIGKVLAEDLTGDPEMIYETPKTQDYVFTHGKAYRVAFLREKGIRFDESLSFQEDSLFNAVIIANTPHTRIGYVRSPMPMYVWIRRKHSVTNSGREDEAVLSTFIRNLKVTEENRKRGDEFYCGMVTRTAWDTYYIVNGTKTSREMQERILAAFVPWFAERVLAYGRVDQGIMEQIRSVSRMELWDGRTPDKPEDVLNWLYIILKRGVFINGNTDDKPGPD